MNVNSVQYVVEGDFAPVYPTRELRRNDQNGDQSALQIRTEPATLTVTLQRPTTANSRPKLGEIANVDSVNWVVTSVTPHEPMGEYHTFEISLRTPTVPTN
jgi:hypothetical protein